MRIISGKYRGKKLLSPQHEGTRPTTDRIKETMFNILFSLGLPLDARVLDLFAGSGALGIEALSRDAREVTFIDIDTQSVALIKDNLKKINVTMPVFHADYKLALRKLSGKQFDLIFLDPPYGKGVENNAIALINQYDILADDGTIMVEHSLENDLQKFADGFIIDTRECGNTLVSILRREDKICI